MGKKHPLRVPHPRNIYREKPNIKELALQFPEFREFAIQSLDGHVTMNFKDKNALRALTKVLLKKDFGLVVDIPVERLVPTVPLRLNYLLWIEDLISSSSCNSSNVYGIDIGTGASCIYALLAARKNGYHMLATEADDVSFKYACENVMANNLQDLVTVKKVTEDTFLCKLLDESEMIQSYDFCMCNPPFFDVPHDDDSTSLLPAAKNRTGRRLPPKGALTGTKIELSAPGGEVAFIGNLINDSFILKDNIKIYTSMVGHRSNVDKLVSWLVKSFEIGKEHVTTSPFHQGNVTRWGIAWTFAENITFSNNVDCGGEIPQQPKKRFPKPPAKHIFENIKMDDAIARIRYLLDRIQVRKKVVEKKDGEYCMELTSCEETWKNQRKRRREEERRKKINEGDEIKKMKTDEREILSGADIQGGEAYGQQENSNNKCDNMSPAKETEKSALEDCDFVLRALMLLKNDSENEDKVVVEMSSIGGTGGWNAVHQVLTYLKNHWHRNL